MPASIYGKCWEIQVSFWVVLVFLFCLISIAIAPVMFLVLVFFWFCCLSEKKKKKVALGVLLAYSTHSRAGFRIGAFLQGIMPLCKPQ